MGRSCVNNWKGEADERMSYVLNGTPALPQPVSPEPLSEEDRHELLEAAVASRVQQGSRLVHEQRFSATLEDGQRPNHLLHLVLTLITLGLWLIPWIVIGVTGGKRESVIEVDEHGKATLQKVKR